MDSFEDSAMIALLPTSSDWCQLELPHMTLVYAGEINKLRPSSFNALAKNAASVAMLSGQVTTKVLGVEVFGDAPSTVDVLKLEPTTQILSMRHLVEEWDASEWPFSPHATMGPEGASMGHIPLFLTFDRIMVAWGNENITFWLKPLY